MYRLTAVIVLCACTSAFTGCAMHPLQGDQDKIRCALLDLYTDQIMDNLVRQHSGLPIIQLDYINANATLTITGKASAADALVTTAPGVLSVIKGSPPAVAKTTMNTLTASVSG